MNKIRVFFILTGYQFTWLACVFGESKFLQPNLGIYMGIIYLSLYFYLNNNKKNFLKVAFLISIPGYFFDTFMVYFNIYEFNASLIIGTLPLWMIFLWLSFSTLFDGVLNFFKNYKILGLFLSSFLGPLTYYFGETIEVISIKNQMLFVILMVIFWFLLMFYYLEYILKKI